MSNLSKLVQEIKEKYKDKNIVFVPNEENPTEILIELEPTKDHPERSLALAVVGNSEPHYHKVSTEIYEVTSGTLTVAVDGKKHVLEEGEKITIKPNQIHSAEGDGAWFLTYTTPGWTFEDHILV